MTRSQPSGPEPYHRQWLHAAEGDATVDCDVLQVLRIYSDEAGLGDGLTASMTRKLLHRLTHLSYDRLQTVHGYAEEHGWLVRVPGPDKRSVYYALEIGRPGEPRNFRGRPAPDRSVPRTDIDPSHGSKLIRGTDRSDRSVPRINTIRPTDRSGPNRSVGRIPTLDLDREIDLSISLEPGSPLDLLRQVDGTVDETVAGEVAAILRGRGVRDPARVLYANELPCGRGPALIAEARQRLTAPSTPADPRLAPTPVPPQYADRCGWCSRLGHDADNCPNRPEPEAPAVLTEAETPCAAGESCRQRRPDLHGQEYHEACEIFGGLRAAGKQAKRADRDEVGRRIAKEQLAEMQAAAPSQDDGHAA